MYARRDASCSHRYCHVIESRSGIGFFTGVLRSSMGIAAGFNVPAALLGSAMAVEVMTSGDHSFHRP